MKKEYLIYKLSDEVKESCKIPLLHPKVYKSNIPFSYTVHL